MPGGFGIFMTRYTTENIQSFPFPVSDFNTGLGLAMSNIFQTSHGPIEIIGHQVEFPGKLPDFVVLHRCHPIFKITVLDNAMHIGNNSSQGAHGSPDVKDDKEGTDNGGE